MHSDPFNRRAVVLSAVALVATVIAYVAWSVIGHPYAHFGEQSKAVSDDLNARSLASRMVEAHVLKAWLDPRDAAPLVTLDVFRDGKSFQYVSREAGDYIAPALAVSGSSHQVIGYMIEVQSADNRGVWVSVHTTADREKTSAHEVAKGIEDSVLYTINDMLAKDKVSSDRAASWAADDEHKEATK